MTIAIIGAGAAGLMAAHAAAQAGARVLLLEQHARVGKKIMTTGNGRCNLLNMQVAAPAYHGADTAMARALLGRYSPEILLSHWESLGLICREEAAGRVYPVSGHAGAVLDVLRAALEGLDVTVKTDCTVTGLRVQSKGFSIHCADGTVLDASRVIVTTGGKAGLAGKAATGYALLKALGHPVSTLRPALVPLTTSIEAVRGLKGVRVQATLHLCAQGQTLRTETGELLFADAGLSGVAAMQCARMAGEALASGQMAELVVDLLPERSPQAWAQWLATRAATCPNLNAVQLLAGLVHPRIALRLLAMVGARPDATALDVPHDTLGQLLRAWPIPLTGTQGFERAQVTAGGAQGFDGLTLESQLVPGLYAAGEVLDVDGDCGGYNLMWAWASGLAAGRAAAGIKESKP